MENIPNYHDVVDAADRISGFAKITPLIENQILNDFTGARVFIKLECLQHTGSFKFRGALNAISMLDSAQKKSGVVACSSGNHGQGVAEAARLLGVSATIIMPEDSPAIKLARTRRSGAKIITYQRAGEDRDEIARLLCAKSGGTFIHPYDNRNVIAGQGTVGLEIAHQIFDTGNQNSIATNPLLDRALVCTSGGGLICGTLALALTHHFAKPLIPMLKFIALNAARDFDDYRRSLIEARSAGGKPLANQGSICDALLSPKPGKIGFDINRNILAEGLAVSALTHHFPNEEAISMITAGR